MFNIQDLINELPNAVKIETTLSPFDFKGVTLTFNVDGLDVSYGIYSSGSGFCLRWAGFMEHTKEKLQYTKEDFSIFYIEVLKELIKREGDVK